MIHIYEVDDGSDQPYYDVYKTVIDAGYNEEFQRTLQNDNEFQLYLDIIKAQGLDFVIHTLEEYDEYHVALPSV